MIDLCILGTGGTLPLPDRALSSLYVRYNGHSLLIDCGEGTQVQIRRLGWGFRCIDGVLLTHYHGDHCTGLPGLLLSMAKAERTDPFHIYGPVGLKRIYEGLMVIAPALPFPVVLHELPMNGGDLQMIGIDIHAFPLDHGVPCLGYRMTLHRAPAFDPAKARELNIPQTCWKELQQGRTLSLNGITYHPEQVYGHEKHPLSILYATDTRPTETIVTYGTSTDLMILEGMYGDDEKLPQAHKNHHMLFREAADLAARAGTARLLLTHFSTSVDEPEHFLPNADAIFSGTIACTDGMCCTITADGQLHIVTSPETVEAVSGDMV